MRSQLSLVSVCAHGAIDPTRMVQVKELKLIVDWQAQPDLGQQGHEQLVDIFCISYFDCGLCVWYLKLRGGLGVVSFAFIRYMILQQGVRACIHAIHARMLRLIRPAWYNSRSRRCLSCCRRT